MYAVSYTHLDVYKRQDLCPACQYLDLQLDGADFQVGYKGIDDVPLFLGAAQHKICLLYTSRCV